MKFKNFRGLEKGDASLGRPDEQAGGREGRRGKVVYMGAKEGL